MQRVDDRHRRFWGVPEVHVIDAVRSLGGHENVDTEPHLRQKVHERYTPRFSAVRQRIAPVSYTHLRAHENVLDLVCRLLLEKKKHNDTTTITKHDQSNTVEETTQNTYMGTYTNQH